jgi:V/A-type H+-transporting ATPase subunit I
MQRRMTRVYVISTHEQEASLVCALQKLGVLHIEPVSLSHGSSPRDFSRERHELEGLLLRVKGLRDLLAEVGTQLRPQPPSAAIDLSNLRTVELLDHLEEQVRPRIVERRQVGERLDAATHLQDVISATESLLQELAPLAGRELIVGLGSAEVPAEEITQFLHTQLSERCDVRWRLLPDRRLELAVRVDTEYAPAVKEYLEAKGVRPLALPAHIPSALTLPEAMAQLKRDLIEGPARLNQIDSALRELGREYAAWLLSLWNALENKIAQVDAMIQFGYTDYTLLITGWIPHDEYAQFAQTLRERFAGIVVREDRSPAPPGEIPVALKNNSWSRPYELFLSIMGVPKYGTIDPVPVVSFFFPLFFGIIVGDVGYGAAIGALGLWLRRRFAHSALVRQVSQIALHCAVATIFFGAIFAEFFGFVLPYPHFKRGEQPETLMLFCVALGATQILLGFVLGAINALREHHGKHALAKLAAIGALVALGLSVGALAGQLPEALKTPSFALLAAALVLLVLSEGLIGLLELVSYVGNIISYARLMGFGLVGLKIAELINEVGHNLHNILLAVIIGIVGHAANLGLAIFESTVQSARLHYVEFFQKFLELGGRKYEPFREI